MTCSAHKNGVVMPSNGVRYQARWWCEEHNHWVVEEFADWATANAAHNEVRPCDGTERHFMAALGRCVGWEDVRPGPDAAAIDRARGLMGKHLAAKVTN